MVTHWKRFLAISQGDDYNFLNNDLSKGGGRGGHGGYCQLGSGIYLHVITKGRTLALCTTALQRINQQW